MLSDRGRPISGKYPSSSLTSSSNRDAVSISSQVSSTPDPLSYAEAVASPDSANWKLAMQEELANLDASGTWELVNLPIGQKVIKCKWIFNTKFSSDGSEDKYKARLVIKGCSQRPGIDFDEVCAPMVQYPSIRYLISLAVEKDLDIHQMDTVGAFSARRASGVEYIYGTTRRIQTRNDGLQVEESIV